MSPPGFGLRRRRRAERRDDGKPLLAVDVDGVVSLFDFDEPPAPPAARLEMIDGKLHCISVASGAHLLHLAEFFELIWASGWEAQTERLGELLGIPDQPYLRFRGKAKFGSADWKLGPLQEYAAERALAWIDDSFDQRCYEWAQERESPTLLIETESASGLLDVHVEALIGWARSLRAEQP